jgi:superfamily II DNA or RNA helicase
VDNINNAASDFWVDRNGHLLEGAGIKRVKYDLRLFPERFDKYSLSIAFELNSGYRVGLCASNDLTNPLLLRQLSEQDRLVFNLLAQVERPVPYYTNVFFGKNGFELFKAMCKTNNLFLNSQNKQFLKLLAKPQYLGFEWVSTYSYQNEYKICSNQQKSFVIFSDPILLIYSGMNLVYAVDSDYSREMTLQLLSAEEKPFTADNIRSIYEQRDYKLGDDFIHPPHFLEEVYKTRPIPIVKFAEIDDDIYSHRFKLLFDYGGNIVERSSVSPRRKYVLNDETIIRNLRYEQACWCDFIDLDLDIFFDHSDANSSYYAYLKKAPHNSINTKEINSKLNLLRQNGWTIKQTPGHCSKGAYLTPTVKADCSDDSTWLSVRFSLDVFGQKLSLSDVIDYFRSKHHALTRLPKTLELCFDDGRSVKFSRELILPAIDIFKQFKDQLNSEGDIQLHKSDYVRFANFKETFVWGCNDVYLNKVKQLEKSKSNCENISVSESFNGELRPYQDDGFKWFCWLDSCSFGGVLADDMGLGKTIQSIAFMDKLKNLGQLESPILVLAPVSLLQNWSNELTQFSSSLNHAVLHGSKRTNLFQKISSFDVIITTYSLLLKDFDFYSKMDFSHVFVDEAHYINNPDTKTYQSIMSLSKKCTFALTGTPIENNLSELWSIFSLVNPGLLKSKSSFNSSFRIPIEKHNDKGALSELNSIIGPFFLRRLKSKVANELPEKSIVIKKIQLSKPEQLMYNAILESHITDASEAPAGKAILNMLLKLKQVCCHPLLLGLAGAGAKKQSAKFDVLIELLGHLTAQGKKVLVFSQFTSMIDIIENELDSRGDRYLSLTGKTRNRAKLIDAFNNNNEADIFLISLKSGGAGINLTAADTVIHYDHWWNPACEDQATDRAYRIGQDKPVTVYKLICAGTIDELILDMQIKKGKLQGDIYNGSKHNHIIKYLTNKSAI